MSSLLSERIANAKDTEDLRSILNVFCETLPIDTLKNIINNIIGEVTPNEGRSIQLRSCSIHKIIGHDVMQKVLSFIPHNAAVRSVDKAFNALSAKNTTNRLNQLNEFINDNNFETDFEKQVESIFDLNNTDAFDLNAPKQILLTKREISSEYVDNKQVFHSFEDVFMNDGLTKIIIFIEDGDYILFSEDGDDIIGAIAIIGIGDDVRIILETNTDDGDFRFTSDHVYIENVTINPSESVDLIELVSDLFDSCLWIKNCIIELPIITDAGFYAKKCRFVSKLKGCIISRLNNADSRNFSVLGCTFNTAVNNISSVIQIVPKNVERIASVGGWRAKAEIAGNIKVIGNIFEGEFKSAIMAGVGVKETHAENLQEFNITICFSDDRKIEHNIIVGFMSYYGNPNEIKAKKFASK